MQNQLMMFDDHNLVAKILEKPEAALIVEKVQRKLEDEDKKRVEFYNLITEDDKAEFINGEIIFHSPVMKRHTDASGLLYSLLRVYVEEGDIGWVGIEKTVVRFSRNDYEPDICYFSKEKAEKFVDKQLVFPVPDLVVEILSKTNSDNIKRDRVTKYNDYEKHGVKEYWIIDPEVKTIEQYLLKNQQYELNLKSSEGIIRSQVISGFNIPILAIFDSRINRRTLRQIFDNSLP